MSEPTQAATDACRWHPEARQIGPVEIIVKARSGRPERRESTTFCMGCMAESKPSGPTEFAS